MESNTNSSIRAHSSPKDHRALHTDNEKTAKPMTPSDAVTGLKDCRDILENVLRSRHAAFCSPSPSSTEAAVRRSVRQAANLLDITLSLLRT